MSNDTSISSVMATITVVTIIIIIIINAHVILHDLDGCNCIGSCVECSDIGKKVRSLVECENLAGENIFTKYIFGTCRNPYLYST